LRTLIVHCHPNPESLSGALFQTAHQALASSQRHEIRCIDLYAEGFDPVLSLQERKDYLTNPQAVETNVQSHVDALRWCEHLVFVFPVWFYGPPAMLKGWLERVWLPGVAFLPPAAKGRTARPGLQHITQLTVITHGGAPWWWLKAMGDPCKRLFTRGLRAIMAKKCKVTYLQLHDMNNVSRNECDAFVTRVRHALEAM
jgi:NAD(P)H dehydrogenase (quinone)